jgi:hypothetical protein
MSDANPTEEGNRWHSLGGRMEAVCDRFEAAWKAGRRPSIVDHLDGVPEAHRVALACILFSLETPLIFMGEEYEEQKAFQFFTDHIDPAIAEATREGRRAEVERTSGSGGDAPDPQAVETFERSKLEHRDPDPLFRELLALRPKLPRTLDVSVDGKRVTLTRGDATLELDFDAKTVDLHA